MSNKRTPRRRKRSPMRREAARLLLLGGLALLAWPAYELTIRFDAMIGPLKMFFSMAVGEKVPLPRVIGYIDWAIFRAPLYLLLCMVLGVFAIALRKKRRACLWLLPAAAALGAYGYLREDFFTLRTVRALEAVPFIVVGIGCLLHLTAPPAKKHRG